LAVEGLYNCFMNPAIVTNNLCRIYPRQRHKARGQPAPADHFVALESVTLTIAPGELFGLLGPNGAGKTTLIKILTTLLAPTTGSAQVDGFDVVTQAAQVRERINMVSGGESCGYGLLTVRENLWLFTQLYGVPSGDARQRIDAMLAVVGLTDRADTKISQLSTGLRQKMNFCRGFVTDPKILFLDEPTLGLDVNAARTTRQFLRAWMRERTQRTLLLTTHYMMEADELCDRVAIIDKGKIVACDNPAALKRRVQQHPIFEIGLEPRANGWEEISRLPGVRQFSRAEGDTGIGVRLVLDEEGVVGSVIQHVVGSGARIVSLKKVEPNLEDVFVAFVGHGLAPEEVQA
jgi:ABC-2 type transport system ATP-binding protein